MYDVVVVGGGVNGCGIARDAAGRGLKVLLLEKSDLGSGTSSASTKLIHGGLRYLETYEFALVREALIEREVLWRAAPHIVWPLRFVLPHHRGLRPAWLIRLGLFLYDHLGGRKKLPACASLDLKRDVSGQCLKDGYKKAFEYSDCWVDDARLVILNAMDAAEQGADVRVRCELTSANREGGTWQVSFRDHLRGQDHKIAAKALVNAAGPWVGAVLGNRIKQNQEASLRLVKGSHIVVPRLFDHEKAYIFQNSDKRVVFAIPYEDDFTLIGTTDVDYQGDLDRVEIDPSEIDYLCQSVNEYLAKAVTPDQVVWTYAGVRPLFDDGSDSAQSTTRHYVLDMDHPAGEGLLLSVFGGKITTFRHLAEEVLGKLSVVFPQMGPSWTGKAPLPGGDMDMDQRAAGAQVLGERFAFLEPATARRLIRTYGTRVSEILATAETIEDLGQHFGADLYEREVSYLMDREWAHSVEDVLWRRTKVGLRLNPDEIANLEAWMAAHRRSTGASSAA
ncbi:MAG: glycerol-3-phosphate dehydrogenase [Pseudomonadota bacterium]